MYLGSAPAHATCEWQTSADAVMQRCWQVACLDTQPHCMQAGAPLPMSTKPCSKQKQLHAWHGPGPHSSTRRWGTSAQPSPNWGLMTPRNSSAPAKGTGGISWLKSSNSSSTEACTGSSAAASAGDEPATRCEAGRELTRRPSSEASVPNSSAAKTGRWLSQGSGSMNAVCSAGAATERLGP